MEKWQFNILFFVGVGGTVLMLFAPAIPGMEAIPKNPTAVSGIGLIMTYLITQRKAIVKDHKDDDTPPDEKKEDE